MSGTAEQCFDELLAIYQYTRKITNRVLAYVVQKEKCVYNEKKVGGKLNKHTSHSNVGTQSVVRL